MSLFALPDAEPEGSWALYALGLAKAVEAGLAEPAVFSLVVADLAAALRGAAVTAVAGPEAATALSTAVARELGLPVWQPGAATIRLGLVDAVLNTGVNFAILTRQAREAGVAEVVAVAVVGQAPALTQPFEGLRISALEVV